VFSISVPLNVAMTLTAAGELVWGIREEKDGCGMAKSSVTRIIVRLGGDGDEIRAQGRSVRGVSYTLRSAQATQGQAHTPERAAARERVLRALLHPGADIPS